MYEAFGIINSSGKNIYVDGMQAYRPIGAFSFLGRYRIIDFPISNLTNSDIDRIQVYVGGKPRSLVEHLGTGRHYNINSKKGKLQLLFSEDGVEQNYNTDIAAYMENMEYIERNGNPYVVIVPSYMVYTADFNALLKNHIESEADITLLYQAVDDAKDHYLNCNTLNLNRQKGVDSIEPNRGSAKTRNIFMDTYIMRTDLFINLVRQAKKLSSMYTLADMVNIACSDRDVRGVAHKGFFASITDFKSYYDSSLSLTNIKEAQSLFNANHPIYTRTNNSCPTQYFETAEVKGSVISDGCLIAGTVENSIIGRECEIKKGAVVKNCVVLSGAVIGENAHVENQVVDKHAQIIRVKEVVSTSEHPGYIRREDIL